MCYAQVDFVFPAFLFCVSERHAFIGYCPSHGTIFLPDIEEILKTDIVKRVHQSFGNVTASTSTQSSGFGNRLKVDKMGVEGFNFFNFSIFRPEFRHSADQILMKKGLSQLEISSLNQDDKLMRLQGEVVDLSGMPLCVRIQTD